MPFNYQALKDNVKTRAAWATVGGTMGLAGDSLYNGIDEDLRPKKHKDKYWGTIAGAAAGGIFGPTLSKKTYGWAKKQYYKSHTYQGSNYGDSGFRRGPNEDEFGNSYRRARSENVGRASTVDHFEVLGLDKTKVKSQKEVSKLYKDLSKRYHPDTTTDPKMKVEYEQKMKDINSAYAGVRDSDFYRGLSKNASALFKDLSSYRR